jgi:hypothetical protein
MEQRQFCPIKTGCIQRLQLDVGAIAGLFRRRSIDRPSQLMINAIDTSRRAVPVDITIAATVQRSAVTLQSLENDTNSQRSDCLKRPHGPL